MRPVPRATALILALVVAVTHPAPLDARTWGGLDIPDSLMPAAVRGAGAGFESAWNDLLVASLRARAAGADSAARLGALAARVARAEPQATGGRIAADALRLAARWNGAQRARRVEAAVAESVAVAAQQARRWDEAQERFHAALARYRALGERRREAWVLGSLGVVAFSRGDLAAAESLYREALAVRRAVGDPRLVGNTLNALGTTNLALRRWSEARAFLSEARVVREATGERGALGATLNYLGVAVDALGEPDSAARWFERALELTTTAGDSARTAEVLVNLGASQVRRGALERPLALFERARANVVARGDVRTERIALQNLGDLKRRRGRYAEAIADLERAVALSERLNDPRALQPMLAALGVMWVNLEDPARARPPLVRAVALADSLGDAAAASGALKTLALALVQDGDASGAERHARRALDLAEATGDAGLVNGAAVTLGGIAHARRDAAEALRWYSRAAAAGAGLSVETRVGDLINLGNATLETAGPDSADALYRRALALAEEHGQPGLVWPALLGRGEAAERRGDPDSALGFARRAAGVIETLRSAQGAEAPSITLLARRMFAFEALVHLLQKTGHRRGGAAGDSLLAEAFAWSERGRARALLDRLAGGGETARPVTLGEARATLDARGREALLVVSVGDSSTSAWLVTARGWTHRALPPRPALRARAEVLRRALADPQRAQSRSALDAARALYRMVLEPFERDLRGRGRVIVVADGPLTRVPFEALLAADPRADAVPRGGWLGERLDIVYEASASARAARRAAPAAAGAGGILAVADPRFGAGPPVLAPLPHTADELRALRVLAGADVTALTGAAATRANLLAAPALAGARVLHLATHGAVDEAEPARSGLWMAAPDSAGAPELLSAGDVLGLHLGAALVTLSACETGLGRLERGEGVVGLTRAFMAAGARSVVVSLWAVNDRSTAALMEAFYDRLLRRRMPRERALAEARRALMASPGTRSPFHWAPFVLYGETGPLPVGR